MALTLISESFSTYVAIIVPDGIRAKDVIDLPVNYRVKDGISQAMSDQHSITGVDYGAATSSPIEMESAPR